MARRKYYEQSDFPYHVTNQCINKQWFSSKPTEKNWDAVTKALKKTEYKFAQ